MILLDTHVWLWLLHEPRQLSDAARTANSATKIRYRVGFRSAQPNLHEKKLLLNTLNEFNVISQPFID